MSETKKPLNMSNIQDYQVAMRRVIALARSDYQDGHYLGTLTKMPPIKKADRKGSNIAELVDAKESKMHHRSTMTVVYNNVLVTMWHEENK